MRIGVFPALASIAVVAYAVLAVLSGIDRLAFESAGIVGPSAWPYAENTLLNAAQAAIAQRNWKAAVDLATRAVGSDPVNEKVIGKLGLARLGVQDNAGAEAAFQVSAKLGWRDVPTHLHWLQASIALGDMQSAAIQTDALLRGQTDEAMHARVIDAMLQYQEGRDALVARLRANPPWAKSFATGDNIEHSSLDSLAGRAEVVARGGRGIVECRDTVYMVNRLIEEGEFDTARSVRVATCPQAGAMLNDGNFVVLASGAETSVLDWEAHADGDVAVAPLTGQSEHPFNPPRIRLSNSRASTALPLSQRLIVPAGIYRISWKMPDTAAADAAGLMVSLDCARDLATAIPGTKVTGAQAQYVATMRFDGRCPVPSVAFWLKPGKEVTLSEVRFDRLGTVANQP